MKNENFSYLHWPLSLHVICTGTLITGESEDLKRSEGLKNPSGDRQAEASEMWASHLTGAAEEEDAKEKPR